jgi:phytanoyl-CoA hydroxylase
MRDKNFYNENGYLTIKKFFNDEYCEKISKEMQYWAVKDFNSVMHPDRIEYLIPQCFRNDKKYLTDNVDDIERAIITSKIMRELMINKRLLSKLDEITSEYILPIGSHYFYKEPNTKFANQAWVPHQDNKWTQNINNKLILVHVIMSKSTIENGCMYLYPGSNKEPLLPMVKKPALLTESLNPGKIINIPKKYIDKKIDCVLEKGDIVICHGNTIHGSYPNVSNYSRPTYAIHYMPKGEDFLPGERSRRKIIKR